MLDVVAAGGGVLDVVVTSVVDELDEVEETLLDWVVTEELVLDAEDELGLDEDVVDEID